MTTPTPESDDRICEAFAKIAELGCLVGAAPLNKFPQCWEYQLDERWWIAVNGHNEIKETTVGIGVRPFTCYVEYHGWPAGDIDPRGGVIAAGECANETTLIAALDAAIDALLAGKRDAAMREGKVE